MKLLVVADHESPYIWDFFDHKRFKDIDMIISAGDLKASYLSFLVTMIPAPLFYVPGNHDNRYVIAPPEGCECIDDKVVLSNGLVIGGLGGSIRYSPDSPYQYTEAEMKKRSAKLERQIKKHEKIDILVSHAPAYQLGDASDPCHVGFEALRALIIKYQPRLFLHGHQHLTYGRQTRMMHLGNTTIVNCFGYHIIEI
ncbi:MAG: metallophosphoesterase [Hyphomonadaceae bacterium]|nr:metallophosphoesterase [Clostridia bacterium]